MLRDAWITAPGFEHICIYSCVCNMIYERELHVICRTPVACNEYAWMAEICHDQIIIYGGYGRICVAAFLLKKCWKFYVCVDIFDMFVQIFLWNCVLIWYEDSLFFYCIRSVLIQKWIFNKLMNNKSIGYIMFNFNDLWKSLYSIQLSS